MRWTNAQNRVLENNSNLLVSASAGSGKTTIMLQKVIELLKKGKSIDKLLIMTFTRASASEMKEKLIKKLYDEIRLTNSNHLKNQLELISFANISTIDSFCLSLYKRYFADLGLQPALENIDSKESKLLFTESLEEVIEDYLKKEYDEEIEQILDKYAQNRDIQPLKDAVVAISNFLDVQTDEHIFLEKSKSLLQLKVQDHPAVNLFISHHIKLLRRHAEACLNYMKRNEKQSFPETYMLALTDIYNIINKIIINPYLPNFANAIRDVKFEVIPNYYNKTDTSGCREFVDELKNFRNNLNKYIMDLKKNFEEYYSSDKFLESSKEDIISLLNLTLTVRNCYKNKKLKRRQLDFADLSKIALKILAQENLRQEIAKMYDYVFVDEYQDINYIQEQIINYIAREDNLFVVGDVKQAIYQFRHAEPKIFLERYYKYENAQEGARENLNENFRSDKRILEFINYVFNEVMDSEFGGVDYKNNAELKTLDGLEFPIVSDMPAVEVWLYDKLKQEDVVRDVYSVKDATITTVDDYSYEGVYISAKIEELVGKKAIYDAKRKDNRLIEYRDITILMYKREAQGIMKELDKKRIPYSAPGFSAENLYQIDLLIDYLRVIENMRNDIPLASVMQSPFYNFSPKEMLRIRDGHPKGFFWEAVVTFSGNKLIKDKIDKMLLNLDRYRGMLSYCNVYELLLRILEDGYDAYLLSHDEEITAQINIFINSVKNKEYSININDFLEFYDKAFENIGATAASANAVNIMTIHNSKGLEFPIVFVANAHKGYVHTHTSHKDIFLDNELGIATKHFHEKDKVKTDTILIKGFKVKEEYREKEELLRLMYVALTRAKNHLYIVGENADCKYKYNDMQDNFSKWLNLARIKNPILNKYFLSTFESANEEIMYEQKIDDVFFDLNDLRSKYKFSESTIVPVKYSVTSLKNDIETVDYIEKRNYITQEERISRGINLHKIIEHIDFNSFTKKEIKQEIARLADEDLVDKMLLEEVDIDCIYQLMNSDLMHYARRNKCFREKRFMLYLPLKEVKIDSMISDKVLVQGAIDLLILGERNTLVDFKVSQSPANKLRERYGQQLNLYKTAVERLLGIQVHDLLIYIINKNLTLYL